MKQSTVEKKDVQIFTVSSPKITELSKKIQTDIAFLREKFDVMSEEAEEKLIGDLERFFFEDIAKEIRFSLYDPLQNNRVFLEYCYKVEAYSSPYSTGKDSGHHHCSTSDIPETCLFDIFIYYSQRFMDMSPSAQKEFLQDYAMDWYDLDFNLQYSKKHKRKRAGIIHDEGVTVQRYVYEFSKQRSDKIFLSNRQRTAPFLNETLYNRNMEPFEQELINAINEGDKLFYVVYSDLEQAIESIGYVLHTIGKLSIRWSLSRGFIIDTMSDKIALDDISYIKQIKHPTTALECIIDNKEERVSYIFEDFHHHIGGTQAISTAVAEVRSLIRDVFRVLRGRNEQVFFLSPSDALPLELAPVFHVVRQETKKSTSFLDKYGTNMTAIFKHTSGKPLVGRNDKVKRIIQILCQMETNNPLLVGGAGVGKTALVEGLAAEINKGKVPPLLQGKTIFSLNLNAMVAGSRYRGDFEERINRLMEEVQSHSRDMIIFIDEIHTLLGAGSAEGTAGAEDILKPALARGDFPCIGATTYEGYTLISQDQAFARRFQKIDIQPATVREAEEILSGVAHVFEQHHGLKITEDAITAAVKWSEECIRDQFLPGKAIRLLDSTSAFVKLDGGEIVRGTDVQNEIKRASNNN